MKRLALLLPVILGTLALAACGGTSSNGTGTSKAASGGSSSGGHTTITVWQGDTETEAAAFKALVAEFNRTHPTITVNSQFYGNSDYALQKELAAIAGGQAAGHLVSVWLMGRSTSPPTRRS